VPPGHWTSREWLRTEYQKVSSEMWINIFLFPNQKKEGFFS
jgi:hypothetical protein